ncbi:cysteine methyltransferase [Archaeoglobales archaeon]|nr:MAG: cysteine methyltransferase [Archaeoglobales archaeon]
MCVEQFSVEWLTYVNVIVQDKKVISVKFDRKPVDERIESRLVKKLKKDLERYFSGKKVEFNYPIVLKVSEFVERVLNETSKIPYGKTMTYKGLAEKLNSKAYRAVGMALSKNPTPILIPCHRVVSKRGLGGYSSGVEIKRELLRLEGIL